MRIYEHTKFNSLSLREKVGVRAGLSGSSCPLTLTLSPASWGEGINISTHKLAIKLV